MTNALHCSGYDVAITDIVRAAGNYVYDSSGKRYMDFEAGVWCSVIGHSHPRMLRVMRDQSRKIVHAHYRYITDIMETAATRVLDKLGMDGKCLFLCSGSEAVELGAQIGRFVTGKKLMLTMSGMYFSALGVTGNRNPDEWVEFDWTDCAACPQNKQCDAECPLMKKIPFEKIGVFVFEPGNSSGLVKLPPDGPVRVLTEQVHKNNGLVAVDEVTTGMGRTGTWFGFQHYSIQPDIVALGKGLGNGYPVSAVAVNRGIGELLEQPGFHYAQSHQNAPLGCAVALETIAVIEEKGLIEKSSRLGVYFLQQLEQLANTYTVIKQARGRGLMLVIEFIPNNQDFSLDAVYRYLLEQGMIAGYKPAARILRFYPPLTITKKEIDQLIGAIAQGVRIYGEKN